MAITFSNLTSGTALAVSQVVTGGLTVAVGDIVLVAVQARRTDSVDPSNPTVTGELGNTWAHISGSPIFYDQAGSTRGKLAVLYSVIANAGTSSLTIGLTSAHTVVTYIVDKTAGVDLTTPLLQQEGAFSASATSLSVALAAFGDAVNNAAYGVHCHDSTGSAMNVDAGFTQLDEDSNGTTGARVQTEYRIGEDLAVAATWANPVACAGFALELKAAAAALSVSLVGVPTRAAFGQPSVTAAILVGQKVSTDPFPAGGTYGAALSTASYGGGTWGQALTTDIAESGVPAVFATGVGPRRAFGVPSVSIPPVGVWISPSELAALPTSGTAYTNLQSYASLPLTAPDLGDINSPADVETLAAALYGERTASASHITAVEDNIAALVAGTHGYVLPAARGLQSYVIAADIIGYSDAGFNSYLDAIVDENIGGRAGLNTLRDSARYDPTNWGDFARCSLAAIAVYRGDTTLLDQVADAFLDLVGRSAGAFDWDANTAWQPAPTQKRGILPVGASLSGNDVSGALPEEMRRGSPGGWPPVAYGSANTNYPWEGMQGIVAAAHILERVGYDTINAENQAVLRAANFLAGPSGIDYDPDGDDEWQPWLIRWHYGSAFAWTPVDGANPGKGMAFTDWTHATAGGGA